MATEQDSRVAEKLGILARLLKFLRSLFRISTGEHEEKYLMKRITANLKQNRKYFQINTQMVTPALAEAVYAIYKTLSPAQRHLERFRKPGLLASLIIEKLLPAEIISIVEELYPDTIIEKRNQGGDTDEILEEVKQNIANFVLQFDTVDTEIIYIFYNAAQNFLDFIRFPYYYFLKKFDLQFKENNFSYKPCFQPVEAKYLIDDIIDFIDGLYALSEDVDWSRLFAILERGGSKKFVSMPSWEKILRFRENMMQTKTLQHIVQYVVNDPVWKFSSYRNNVDIVKEYILKMTQDAELTIKIMTAEEDQKKIAKRLVDLFGDNQLVHNQNYSELFSEPHVKKIYKNQAFVQPLDFIKTFHHRIFEKEIEQMVKALINHGKWASDYYQQKIIDAFNGIIEISQQILSFNNDLSGEETEGIRIRSLIQKIQNDPYSRDTLIGTLKMINSRAENLVKISIRFFADLSDCISYLADENESNKKTMILNLKEISTGSRKPIEKTLADILHKINSFIELLNLCMSFAANHGSHEMDNDILSRYSIQS